MKTKVSIAAGFAVSALLLWLALRNIEFGSLAGIYARMEPLYLLPVAAVALAELLARGARWRLLLLPSSPSVKLSDAFKLEAAGLALNNILPLRLGELVRATFAARVFSIPVVTVLATILVERLLDVIVLFLLFAAAAEFGGITGGLFAYNGLMWTLVAGVAAGIAALIFSDELVAHAWFSGFFARFPRVRAVFERVAMGVKGLHTFRSGSLIFLFAALQWLFDALNFWLLARAFGLGGTIDAFRSVALIFAGAAAASVPGMPGYFGNYELVLVKVLKGWGVQEGVGFAFVSCMHVFIYVFITLLGVAFIYQMGQSLGRVWSEFKSAGKDKA
ncbi:MAG: lysylphosphatidylglycerol synthase transmembrane domain-containing protein [Elusimicrobia bacterium]|nr:lysylphosphatidylglycerol synthase transmembrane domain-containing protein [Elusimicrobiota bacterium]